MNTVFILRIQALKGFLISLFGYFLYCYLEEVYYFSQNKTRQNENMSTIQTIVYLGLIVLFGMACEQSVDTFSKQQASIKNNIEESYSRLQKLFLQEDGSTQLAEEFGKFGFGTFEYVGDTGAVDTYEVTVTAGAFNRENTIISFPLPYKPDDGVYLLLDESEEEILVQVKNGTAYFIIDELLAYQSETYIFLEERLNTDASLSKISKETDANSIRFISNENELLAYFHQESNLPDDIDSRFKRAGYIHPVNTPEGVRITQHFNPARPHQYGIWSAWAYADFQNRSTEFWGSHLDSGRLAADSVEDIWEGPVLGGFIAKHRFVDFSAPEPETALNEEWRVNIFHPVDNDRYYIFDMEVYQTANTGNPVNILQHQYGYGGINFRGHDDWIGEGNMDFLSSEGFTRSEVSFNGVRWSHMSGKIEESLAGIGIMGHPDNADHPLGVFINEVEPFFSYGPIPVKELLIQPGSPYTMKFRFIVHDGEMSIEELDRLWEDFAYPPGVTVNRR